MARKVYEEFVGYSNNNSDISNIENPDISTDWHDTRDRFNKQLSNNANVSSNMDFNDPILDHFTDNANNNNNFGSSDDRADYSPSLLNDKSNQINYSPNRKSTNISYSSFFSDHHLQSPIRNSKFYTDNNTYTQSVQDIGQNDVKDDDDDDDSSSITIHSSTRLSHDPFDTVQQRHKSSNRTTMDDPEFLSYLRKGQGREYLKHGNPNMTRNNLNDLIVKGIGELSGEVYNTFKNKRTKSNNNNNNSNNDNKNDINNDSNTDKDESLDFDNLDNNSSSNDSNNNSKEEREDEQDTEDLETSNEVLRDANNVFDDMILQNKNKMTLITPLVAGLNFENNLGKWVRDTDQTNSQDISANHTAADISSSMMTSTTTTRPSNNGTSSKINLFKNMKTNKDDNNNNRKVGNSKLNGQISMLDDTPLPFRIKTNFENIESSIESLEEHKMQLIRKLTPLLIDTDWEMATELNATGQNLQDVTSLALCLPSLIKCDLSNNNIKTFNSGDSIPTTLIELNLSKNLLNDIYLYNNKNNSNLSFNNVKILNLSNNQFKTDLSWLKYHGFTNLQELNLSWNEIRSLHGLPTQSMIKRIDLSGNCIEGKIDFEELMEEVGEYGWQSIEHLDLSNNRISEVYNVDKLRSLRSINLNGNPLESMIFYNDMDPECSSGSSSGGIEILKMRSNRLKIVGKSINKQFLPLPRLKELEITCYKNFAEMGGLPDGMIKLLVLGGNVNDLIAWDKIPGSIRTLEIVGVEGLSELPRDPMMEIRLTSVQELNLSHNSLSSWENLIQFLPYSHLKTLKLDGNEGLLCEKGQLNRERLEPELKSLLKRAIPSLQTVTV